MRRKYIVIDGWFGVSAICFPECIPHKTVFAGLSGEADVEVLGAGFYKVADGIVFCYDKSIGLGVASRGAEDAKVIAKQLMEDGG